MDIVDGLKGVHPPAGGSLLGSFTTRVYFSSLFVTETGISAVSDYSRVLDQESHLKVLGKKL